MKIPHPVCVDFETMGIMSRPIYPPAPVGVSIKYPGKKSKYYAFGHVTKNSCSWGEAKAALEKAWSCKDGVLFQNGKFDVDVAEVHMGMKPLPWDKVEDTLFLLFLDDPNQTELGLKPSANRLLGMPPEEQDVVADWLINNQPIPNVKISRSKASDHYYGKYIAFAPGDLVGKYAEGDTDRTEQIFDLLYPKTVEREMLGAYDRERELSRILLEIERLGIRVDLDRLRADVGIYTEWQKRIDEWIIKAIKADADINLNSGEQLISAMIASKKVNEDIMPRTPTGKFQTNKDALLIGVTDKVLLSMLKYRASLKTCVGTFMGPWLEMAEVSNGYIYTQWNQTKSSEGANAIGARTGRLSATWFMNMPKDFDALWQHQDPKKPKCPLKGIPDLPQCRGYVIPYFDDHVLIDRDYSQQEPRILAHFDGGALMDKYIENPWIDLHDYAKAELEKMGKFYARKQVKGVNLGLIYGMGVGKLAEKNEMSVAEAGDLKKAVLTLYPGLKEMYKDAKARSIANLPVRTWGGREYFCEPKKLVNGRMMEFSYKVPNALIQGSAADCTKQAVIEWWRKKAPDEYLLFNVHDQITCSVPKKKIKPAMEKLRVAMEGIQFDVPMLSEGSWSDKSWADLIDFDKKGAVLYGN
jgi:DNA polymerase I-like protein with 3'-5' exonuclease and polymerase domains